MTRRSSSNSNNSLSFVGIAGTRGFVWIKMGSFMSSVRALSIFLASRNLCHNYNTLLSLANCYRVLASELPVIQNGNCGVPPIQLLVSLKKTKQNKTPSPFVLSIMFAQKSEEEKGRIFKYLRPLYLPLLPFILTETVPQLFSIGPPTVFSGRYKSVVTTVTNRFLPPVRWVKREYLVLSLDQRSRM